MDNAPQPLTMFTGQWVDLPLEEVASLAASWGYDGIELACSGEHLDIWRAAEDPAYLAGRKAILDRHGLKALGHLQPFGRARRTDARTNR